ncbi:MAG: hypothetical protein LC130_11445 [Bryobacterales bacterium]|nr:hypothetical protein [Bryobacterales bacterium]
MKTSTSIELLWQMAAQEAIAGEFAEIEPEHFFAAVLKFAEIPVAELGNVASGAHVPEELAADVEKVRQVLQSREIDTTRVRRELRTRLGKGRSPYDGGQKHRSEGSREMFNAAARLADDSGSEVLGAEHLFAALLASPTEAMRAVMGEALAPQAIKRMETPLLARWGHDLVELAVEGALSGVLTSRADCRALLHLLAESRRRSVVLVSDRRERARSVVAAAAWEIAHDSATPALRRRRIVAIGLVAPLQVDLTGSDLLNQLGLGELLPDQDCCPRCGAIRDPEFNCRLIDDYGDSCENCYQRAPPADQAKGRIDEIVAEVTSISDTVLLLPAIDLSRASVGRPDSPAAHQSGLWAAKVKTLVMRRSVQCVCPVTPYAYDRFIEKDLDWKKHAHAMWIEGQATCDIPLEL